MYLVRVQELLLGPRRLVIWNLADCIGVSMLFVPEALTAEVWSEFGAQLVSVKCLFIGNLIVDDSGVWGRLESY